MRHAPEQPNKDNFNFAESKREAEECTHKLSKRISQSTLSKTCAFGGKLSCKTAVIPTERKQTRTSYTEYEVDA